MRPQVDPWVVELSASTCIVSYTCTVTLNQACARDAPARARWLDSIGLQCMYTHEGTYEGTYECTYIHLTPTHTCRDVSHVHVQSVAPDSLGPLSAVSRAELAHARSHVSVAWACLAPAHSTHAVARTHAIVTTNLERRMSGSMALETAVGILWLCIILLTPPPEGEERVAAHTPPQEGRKVTGELTHQG